VAEDENAFVVEREPGGAFRVRGVRVERAAAMTDWDNEAAVARFQRVLWAMGVTEELRGHGIRQGDTVHIGRAELEWTD
jgi:GTP-binding protein